MTIFTSKQCGYHFRSTCTVAHENCDLFYVPSSIPNDDSESEEWMLEFSNTHCSIIGPSQPRSNNNSDTDTGSKRYISLSYDSYDGNYAAIEALCSKAKDNNAGMNFIIAHRIFIALLIDEPVFFSTSPNARSNWTRLFNDPFLKFLRKFYRFHYFCDPTNFSITKQSTEDSGDSRPEGNSFYYSLKQKKEFAIKWIEALANTDGEHNHWLYNKLNYQPVLCKIKPDTISLDHESRQKDIEARMEDAIKQLEQFLSQEKNEQIRKEGIISRLKKPPSQISHTINQTVEWFKKRYSLKLAHKYSAKPNCKGEIRIQKFNNIYYGFALIFFMFSLMVSGSIKPHIDTQLPYIELLLIMIFWVALLPALIYWLWSTRRAHLIKLIVSIMIGNIALAQGGDYFADLIRLPMEASKSSTDKLRLLAFVDVTITIAIFFYLKLSVLSRLSRYESEWLMLKKSTSVFFYGLCVSLSISVLSYPIFSFFDDTDYSSGGAYITYLVSYPWYFWWMIFHWSILALFIGLFLQMFWQDNTTE